MTSLTSERGSWLPELSNDWRRPLARRRNRSESNANLLIAGVVVVGLGWLTWNYLGPDVRRYLKIRAM